MDLSLIRYLLPLLLVLQIGGTDLNGNGPLMGIREPKSSRRIVRLYAGTRPTPIVCSGEGFQADPEDCTVFHRCMRNGNGRYVSFRFQCGPGTIYDPESEICNHPERTKRTNCGGNGPIHVPNIESAFDNDISKEVPFPISTNVPIFSQKVSSLTVPIRQTTHTADKSTLAIKYPWAVTSHRYSEATVSPAKPWTSSASRQDGKTSKTLPTKREVTDAFSNSMTPSWMTTQKIRSTPSRINKRQSTPQTGDICTTDGFMGDSENCRKFYRCINNQRGGFIRYEFMCTESTIWDDDTQACNYAWAVKRRRCGRGSAIDNNESKHTDSKMTESSFSDFTTSANSAQSQLQINYGSKVIQTQTQISNGTVKQNQTQINYGHGVDNNAEKPSILQNQTQISHGNAISQTQTQINYGDKAMQTQLQIDHSKESSQSQSQISESTSTTKTTQHHEPQATTSTNSNNKCSESGFMGDEEDCKKFYRCVNNGRGGFIRYEFSCGEGTVWDPKLEACNHAWAVKECGGKTSSDSTTQSTTRITQSSPKATESSSILTTPSTTTTTTSTQGYSPTQEMTEEDNDIDIPYGNQPTSSAPSKPPQQETKPPKGPQSSNDNNCRQSGFMGDSNDCKKFYRCVDNGNNGYTRYEFSCGEGTVWDQTIEACNHAWAVKNCGGNTGLFTTASSTQSTSTQASSEIPPFNDDYDTGYGSGHDKPLSSTTASTAGTASSTTISSHSSQSSNENDCTSSGFMGDNKDCKKFYRCVENGSGGYTKYEFSCGEGTVWDSKIQACNHAWAVEKCGGHSTDDINKVESTTRKEIQSTTQSTHSSSIYTPEPDDNNVGYGQQSNEPQPDTTTSSKPNQNSDRSECQSSGFMGDKSDCKKFYRCVDNGDGTFARYEFTCGEGTVWDSKIDACNHAWAVEKCGHSTTQTTSMPIQTSDKEEENAGEYPISNDDYSNHQSTTITSSSSTTATSISNTDNSCKTSGFMGDNTDCKKFIRCVENGQGGFTRYEFSCGEGTVWDQSIESCNHAWAVKGHCSQSSESNNAQPTTQTSSVDHETDLSQNSPTTQIPSSSISPTSSSDNQCKQEGFYGEENNCKNFYRCVDNGKGGFTKYDFVCGDGTVWNQDIQACDHENSNKMCSVHASETTSPKPDHENDEISTESTTKHYISSTTTGDSNYISQKPQPSSNTCEMEGFYGDSSDCKKFYRCVDDGKGGFIKYDFACGEGTVWDQEILACNHETSVKNCTVTAGSSSSTTSTTEKDNIAENSSSSPEQQTTRRPESAGSKNDQCETEGFFPNTNDCKKFYRCVSNGKGGFTKYDFSCGEGTIWVQEIQACDYDNDISSCSNTGNSSEPQTTHIQQSTTESTSISQHTTQSQEPVKEDDEYSSNTSSKPPAAGTGKCTSEGFFADEKDCTRFYRCVENGQSGYTKYDFACGEGTAWDSNIQTCNHISEVENCQNTNNHENQTKPNNDEEPPQSNDNTSTTKDSTSTESSKPANMDKCDEEGYFGNTQDCTKFYRCVDNGKGGFTKYDFTCGEGTIWDQDLTTCNHPQDVVNPSCSNNESQSPSDTSSSTEGSEMTSSSSTSSQSTTESNSQGSSNCSQESTSKKPANQNVKCDKAGFYPNPDDCKKFYRCVDWDGDGKRFSVYHFECGEGTIWDPQLETCNHEESVYPPRDCSGAHNQSESSSEGTTEKSTTTTDSSTETESSTEGSTTTQSSSSEQTTEQSSTTEKSTTAQQTTQQSTTESTTTQQTTSSLTTTEQTTTTEEQTTQESTTQQPTSSEQTTQGTTTSEKTTTQSSTTSEQTTTQSSTTSEQTTTQSSTTSEQTTTQSSTTSEQTTTQSSTTSEQTTTQSSTTSEPTTTQSSTTSEQTTTQSSTTSEQTTTQESTTSEQTTQESTTSEQTTAQQTTASEQTTTGEETTSQQSTTSEQTTQQSSTSEQTTQQSSNTDKTTTESTTAEQTTTTEQSNQQNTTDNTTEQESSTTTTESNGGTTTESDQSTTTQETSSEKECPETDDDQYMFVCPTSFRRHPKYCNMFYQCTEDDNSHEMKIATFKCPNNTIYDESKTQCVEENKADKKCNGQIARKYRVKRLNADYKEPIESGLNKHTCTAAGYYPFEKDSECSGGFLKCQKTKSGKLRGYVHRCPDGYTYWSISKRCEKDQNMKGCKQSINNWKDRWEIPVEKKNIAK